MSTASTSFSNHGQMGAVEEGTGTTASQDASGKGKGLGERARGLMGGRFGSIRGQPGKPFPHVGICPRKPRPSSSLANGPSPLPPLPTTATAGPSRPNMFTRSSSRTTNNPNRQSSLPAPSYPPPSASLPHPPHLSINTTSGSSYAPTNDSTRTLQPALPLRHRRQDSTVSQRSNASSISIPGSPSHAGLITPPLISPRSTSLASQGSVADHPESNTAIAERRVPSRQLLQTALDLAQRAVEMDQGNDVLGALSAYREAVTRLKAVMERVGIEGREGRRGNSGKAEEEGRTLKGIVSWRIGLTSRRLVLKCSMTHMSLVYSFCSHTRLEMNRTERQIQLIRSPRRQVLGPVRRGGNCLSLPRTYYPRPPRLRPYQSRLLSPHPQESGPIARRTPLFSLVSGHPDRPRRAEPRRIAGAR
jgi:hypothetical protein